MPNMYPSPTLSDPSAPETPVKKPVAKTTCSHCGTTSTPLWRRSPEGQTICNACGLYYKARNKKRPHWLKHLSSRRLGHDDTPADMDCDNKEISDLNPGHEQEESEQEGAAAATDMERDRTMICSNCGTTQTPLWRRNEQGCTICNACGLYYKLHRKHRPVSMKRTEIKRRKRSVANSINSVSGALSTSTPRAITARVIMPLLPSRAEKTVAFSRKISDDWSGEESGDGVGISVAAGVLKMSERAGSIPSLLNPATPPLSPVQCPLSIPFERLGSTKPQWDHGMRLPPLLTTGTGGARSIALPPLKAFVCRQV
ncbi:uncharacterized protein VTP21DRAFT_7134 [Calcarisporiella thermophila]|uniref:uncharacterized protein n=1 Tax=Calcarisporiella thermophila TaxID=911321 RepID=UPI00374203D5